MKITFWHSDKPRERLLADAFADGARAHGDAVELRSLTPDPVVSDCDVACMVGVKSRELYRAHFAAGAHLVYFDKGYTRHAARSPVKLWEYWRVAIDSHQPTALLMETNCPEDRADRLGLVLQPWRKPHAESWILIAGSSAKYHEFYGMKDPTAWTGKLVRELRERSRRPIVYRPKPSWADAVPIEGTRFSRSPETIEEALRDVAVVVTHGSNACFEAVLAGVPCVVLGEAVAKPISSTTLDELESPRTASYAERHQWLNNLAYWQWTMPELASGEAWQFLRPKIYGSATR